MHTFNSDFGSNPLEQFLQKDRKYFTKHDIIRFAVEENIKMVNFRYIANDGKLKVLNFAIHSLDYLDQILTTGERVDGSSLGLLTDAGSSDLYVVPKYSTAFVNYSTGTGSSSLDFLCAYFDFEGKPLKSSPEYILRKANAEFEKATKLRFLALGELEYYIYTDKKSNALFPTTDQKGYHEAAPYSKFDHIRTQAMETLVEYGGRIKYGHSEVGSFTDSENYYEQQEIEFLPTDPITAVEQMVLAKWILRQLCAEHDLNISFAPKIAAGKAGSGLHIHVMLAEEQKDGLLKNVLVDAGGDLTLHAKQMICGMLEYADALTAFGNTIPTAYLRLVPHQEAPTNICWGDRNRSALVRVPLGWKGDSNMIQQINPYDPPAAKFNSKQTAEIRSGDGSADIYLYMAALIVAVQNGLQMKDAEDRAQKLYVGVNIFKDEHKEVRDRLATLPTSCWDSADCLQNKRAAFEAGDIFPKSLIDNVIGKLKAFDDKNLSERLYGKTEEIHKLVMKYIDIM